MGGKQMEEGIINEDRDGRTKIIEDQADQTMRNSVLETDGQREKCTCCASKSLIKKASHLGCSESYKHDYINPDSLQML